MNIRKAEDRDIPGILALAATLSLDHPGMEKDEFWVAEEAGEVVGIVGLKRHPDCLELCSLGVNPRFRGRGLGAALIEALMAAYPAEVCLATAIPGFFEIHGFARMEAAPQSLSARKGTDWCEGCSGRSCAFMVRRKK